MSIPTGKTVIVKGVKYRVIARHFLGNSDTAEYVLRDDNGDKWTTVGRNVTAKSKIFRATT